MAKFTAQTDKEGRHIYAYILVINKKIVKTIAGNWWATPDNMMVHKCYMAAAARAFKKTAGILVYEYCLTEDNIGCWHLCDECEVYAPSVADLQECYSINGLPNMTPEGVFI